MFGSESIDFLVGKTYKDVILLASVTRSVEPLIVENDAHTQHRSHSRGCDVDCGAPIEAQSRIVSKVYFQSSAQTAANPAYVI